MKTQVKIACMEVRRMDIEHELLSLFRETGSVFFNSGARGEPLVAFPGWTPDATPEEEADVTRASIEEYAAERGIAEISATAAAIFTYFAQYALREYRCGIKKAPAKAATLTREGT